MRPGDPNEKDSTVVGAGTGGGMMMMQIVLGHFFVRRCRLGLALGAVANLGRGGGE